MNINEEITRLDELRARGDLGEEEYAERRQELEAEFSAEIARLDELKARGELSEEEYAGDRQYLGAVPSPEAPAPVHTQTFSGSGAAPEAPSPVHSQAFSGSGAASAPPPPPGTQGFSQAPPPPPGTQGFSQAPPPPPGTQGFSQTPPPPQSNYAPPQGSYYAPPGAAPAVAVGPQKKSPALKIVIIAVAAVVAIAVGIFVFQSVSSNAEVKKTEEKIELLAGVAPSDPSFEDLLYDAEGAYYAMTWKQQDKVSNYTLLYSSMSAYDEYLASLEAPEPEEETPTPEPTPAPADFAGRYEIDSAQFEGATMSKQALLDNGLDMAMDFSASGSATLYLNGVFEGGGTYTLVGNTLTIIDPTGNITATVEGDMITLYEPDSGVTMFLKKVA